jgi:CxxC motif-containing protein
MIEDGAITHVEGNNCPTGAEFATSICKRMINAISPKQV